MPRAVIRTRVSAGMAALVRREKGATDDKEGIEPQGPRAPGTPPGERHVDQRHRAHHRPLHPGRGFDHVAAEAAGVSARTFRYWMARGEGRSPGGPARPRLKAFAADVNRARAEVRLAAEIRVYREDPKHWLSRVARTKPDREGWTEPRPDPVGAATDPGGAGPEDVDAELARMLMDLLASGEVAVPPCSHPRCRCPFHRTGPTGGAP